jgi:phosphatidylglycerophosphatase A
MKLLRGAAVAAGSSLYAGFFPLAPASFACFLWSLLLLLVPASRVILHPLALAITFVVAIPVAGSMEKTYGKDASCIVIDELVGFQITLLFVPIGWTTILAGFLLFRVFDVLKPWPIHGLQKLSGGKGVVLDDVLAGVYAWAILRLLLLIFPGLGGIEG